MDDPFSIRRNLGISSSSLRSVQRMFGLKGFSKSHISEIVVYKDRKNSGEKSQIRLVKPSK